MEEIWKDIPNYEGYYEVSNLGRIKSLVKKLKTKGGALRKTNERILKAVIDRYGYQRVVLQKDKEKKCYQVHRLVYEAFIGEIPEGMQVNHKDENKQNNVLSNIDTLMTCKENLNWGTCIERRAKTKSKPVIQKTLQGEVIKIWPSAAEVQRKLGYWSIEISRCCRGIRCRKTAYGYKWEYTEKATA